MQDVADQTRPNHFVQPAPGLFPRTRMFAKSFAAQGLLVAMALLVVIAYQAFYPSQPDRTFLENLQLIGFLAITTIAALFGGLFLLSFYQVARYQKPKSAFIAILKQCWRSVAEPRRAALGVPLLIILMTFMHGFVRIKDGITQIVPFSWDQTFHNMDVWMHFGKAPWEWLHPLFSQSPYLVFILNLNYNFWFFTMWMVVVPFAFATKNTVVRTQFFLAFFLIWAVGGGVLATWFSSAGPAFYGKIGLTPNPYADLMTYLKQVNEVIPIWAYELQNEMWKAHASGGLSVGISAMPSMHNATALLFVIGGWHLSKKTLLPLGIHCFLIYIGSIYLAWHYAVDAYMGWIITVLAWLVAGYIARWWHKRPAIAQFNRELEQFGKKTG